MGRNRPGVRDGTGPYRDSWQRRQTGSKGKRQQSGQKCPKRR